MKKNSIIPSLLTLGASIFCFNHICNRMANGFLEQEEKENLTYHWHHGNVSYQKEGSGHPILILHDLSPKASHKTCEMYQKKLSSFFTVYSVDLPGCGSSLKCSSTYTTYFYAQFVQDFIKHVIKEKTHILAFENSAPFVILSDTLERNDIEMIVLVNPKNIISKSLRTHLVNYLYKKVIFIPLIGTALYNILALKEVALSHHKKDVFANTCSNHARGKYLQASLLCNFLGLYRSNQIDYNAYHYIVSSAKSDLPRDIDENQLHIANTKDASSIIYAVKNILT